MFFSNVAFEELHNKDSNNNKIQFHVFVSYIVCSAGRRAASIWNGIKPSDGRQAETGAERVPPPTPEELQVLKLCNSFCGVSYGSCSFKVYWYISHK